MEVRFLNQIEPLSSPDVFWHEVKDATNYSADPLSKISVY